MPYLGLWCIYAKKYMSKIRKSPIIPYLFTEFLAIDTPHPEITSISTQFL